MARVIESRRRNTRTKTGAVLSAELIVDAALSLVGEHGAAALSVRRLGAAIGCDPTAVYRYFASVDALFLAMADRLIAQALEGFEPGGDWKANLRAIAERTYGVYVAHPRVATAVASRVTGGAHESRVIDLVLGELHRAGFAGEQAVRLYRSFGDFVLAFSAVDADFLARPDEVRAADVQRWQDAYSDVDPGQFPHLAAEAPIVVAHAESSTFAFCLELLLDRLEALAA
ncbi:TetR/AcrR family transcriptional regulator C-terminal domain-containing protein [Actinospica sp. MGRD01-02]|uniref:TetR/AcrR family transcriptional regulator C-terminal domain-containing protein n=1 Tax=Actinospica acidithermotolerans TaxID=2828514 RepID=A0A941EKU3_9ACTN|nr:TetR/AcrR family transcriptional regulator [Actinospica acidithermotolerans]MBR7830934.1 TetR/AcrR family transcriptional regulator C-terminal domain-containing protein [Actinospica acidithermotolerans]